jgi:hypothetical protein
LTLIVIPVVYSLAPGRKRAAWGEAESAERDTRVE